MVRKHATVKNKILNQLVLDVPQGTRTFFLHYGDMLKDDSDMWVITLYDGENGSYGDLKDLVTEQLQLPVWGERRLLMLENGGWVGRLAVGGGTPVILTLHAEKEEGEPITLAAYEEYVKGIFSAIAALEFQGTKAHSLALPVLFRKGLDTQYSEATEILIKYASQFLRQSKSIEHIRYYVYKGEDAEVWSEALDRVLGRVYIDASKDGMIEAIRRELVTVIESFPKGNDVWDHTLQPLRRALTNPGGIQPDKIGAFARKLTEVVTEDICRKEGIQPESIFQNLKKISDNHLMIQWLVQYLHVLRAFGNTAVHPAIKPKYGPKTVQPEDLLILLGSLLRMLKFYKTFLSAK